MNNKMSLTTEEIVMLANAIRQLDGNLQIAPGKAPEKVTYEFAAAVRLRLALNLTKLNEVQKAYQLTHDALVYKFAGAGKTKVPDERMQEFNKEHRKLLDVSHDLELGLLTISDLNLADLKTADDEKPKGNHIPITILSILNPLIAENTPKELKPKKVA